jgi:hypothetical protein
MPLTPLALAASPPASAAGPPEGLTADASIGEPQTSQ